MPLGPFDPIPPREKIRRSHINDLRTALTGIQDAYDVAVANGFVGTRGQWLDSLKGEKGDPGAGLAPIGSAATFAALPATGNTEGDVRTVDDTGRAYRWDGSEWVDVGLFRGPPGDLSKSVADTLYPDKAATEAALGRVDPGLPSTLGQVWAHGPGGPAFRDPLALDIRDYGGTDDNSTDNAAALATALTIAAASGRRTINLPQTDTGVYRVNSTIQVDVAGVTIQSTGQWRSGTTGGATIDFRGTGPLFQLDTDNGAAHDASDYSGTANWFTLRNLHLVCGNPDTPLDGNPVNSYKAGSYAIRDWRCGEVFLDHVGIEAFDYAFWGIASDINEFSNVKLFYSHSGMYFGPRCDQLTLHRLYSYKCDRVLDIDRVDVARIRDCQFVDDGSATSSPIRIRSAWSQGSMGITFDNPWFEHYDGAATIPAFIDIGVGDSVTSYNVVVNNPYIATNSAGSGFARSPYFWRLGRADRLEVHNPFGDLSNLTKFSQTTDTTHVDIRFSGPSVTAGDLAVAFDQVSTGNVRPTGMFNDAGTVTIPTYIGRVNVDNRFTPAASAQVKFGTEGWFEVLHPSRTPQETLSVRRRINHGTAIPVSGTYLQGDIVLNQLPTAGGFVGWVCVTAGSPGTWKGFGVIES